jgi:hypothetical protein
LTLKELVKEYAGKVRVVFMNMVVHPDTVQLAHQYSCAAAKQGKFLEYVNAFWEKGFGAYAASQGRDKAALGEDNILKFAAEMKLDVQKLKADATSADCKQRIDEDMAELKKFRVNGTPAFFINGFHVGGGIPKESFKQIIDEKLGIAEKSGIKAGEYYEKEIMAKGLKQFRSKRDARKAAEAGTPNSPAGPGSPGPGAGSGSAAPKPGAGSGSAAPTAGSGSAAPKPANAGSAAKPTAGSAAPKPAAPKPAGSATPNP